MSISAGTRLEQYEVVSLLGSGGMGEVWRARDTRLHRDVAIKLLSTDLAGDPSRLAQFEAEARSASALNHPNIVTIHEIGQSPAGPYLVMELVEGKTLREVLCAGAPPVRRALQAAAQICDALARAHDASIVHRDLKPENVMLTREGFAKILDFGLAQVARFENGPDRSRRDATLTEDAREGPILGTSGYMSPEQASGQSLDFRSDQFAFGALLYEMLTGRRAFHRATRVETLAAVIRDDPESIGVLAPQVPPPVRWIVERCLAKCPEDRYASTRDLARDIQDVRDHFSQIEAPSESSHFGIAHCARRPRLWLSGRVAAAVVALVAAAYLLGSHAPARERAKRRCKRSLLRRG